jgi:hypothetical protein
VVSYEFDMSFEAGGRVVNLGGRDTFALVQEEGRWWIVLDHFSPYPA